MTSQESHAEKVSTLNILIFAGKFIAHLTCRTFSQPIIHYPSNFQFLIRICFQNNYFTQNVLN